MGRRSDRTEEETVWLASRIQRFYDARQVGQVKAFFVSVVEEWFRDFPQNVNVPETGREEARKNAFDLIFNWFYNNSDKYAFGTLTMPAGLAMPTKKSGNMRTTCMKTPKSKDDDLDLLRKEDKKPGLQAFQVYQIMYRNMIQKRDAEEYSEYAKRTTDAGGTAESSLYKRYCKEERDAERTPRSSIKWNAERIKAFLAEEEPRIKERVAEVHKAYKNGDISKISPEPEDDDESVPGQNEDLKDDLEKQSINRAINAIPKKLNRALLNLHKQTGWSGAFLVGGPSPSGEVTACVFVHGKTKHTKSNWPESDPNFYSHVVGSFENFLQLVYPETRNGEPTTEGAAGPAPGIEVVVDSEQSFTFSPSSATEKSVPEATKSTASKRNSTGKKGKAKFRSRFADIDYSSDEALQTQSDTIQLDSDSDDDDLEIIDEPKSSTVVTAKSNAIAAPKPKKTSTDKRTIYEKKRDANVRFVQAKFALQDKFGLSSDEMKKINEVIRAGYTPDVDDYDISSTLLRKAGLPVVDGLADEAMNSVRGLLQKNVSKPKAPHKRKATNPAPPEQQRRSSRFASKSPSAPRSDSEDGSESYLVPHSTTPSVESDVPTENSGTVTSEGSANGNQRDLNSAVSNIDQVSPSTTPPTESLPSTTPVLELSPHLKNASIEPNDDTMAFEYEPAVDTVTVEPVVFPDDESAQGEQSSDSSSVQENSVPRHESPLASSAHPEIPPSLHGTKPTPLTPVLTKESLPASNHKSATARRVVTKSGPQANDKRKAPDSSSSALHILQETVQKPELEVRGSTAGRKPRKKTDGRKKDAAEPTASSANNVSTVQTKESPTRAGSFHRSVENGSSDWLVRGAETIVNAWPNATTWKRFVDIWKRFEKDCPGSKDGEFPLSDAPQEVTALLQVFASADDALEIPQIADADTIAPKWWAWWRSLQPKWRFLPKHTEKLAQEVPDGESLDCLCRAGQKGMFSVLLGLAVWVSAITHSESANRSFKNAKTDVEWVLLQLSGAEGVLKRRKVAISGADPSLKRKPDAKTDVVATTTKRPRRGAMGK